jgi:hypothetical protein
LGIIHSITGSVKKRWWILVEMLVSAILSFVLPIYLSPMIRQGIDLEGLMLRIGSDALTLMGFTITSLAVIAKQIDRPILDSVRHQSTFKDLWRIFGLTAIALGTQALLLRLFYVFVLPDWVLVISNFLIVFNIFLVLDCIALLLLVVTILNEGKIAERELKDPVDPIFPD